MKLTTALPASLLLALLAACSDPQGPHPDEPPGYTPPRDDHDVRAVIENAHAGEINTPIAEPAGMSTPTEESTEGSAKEFGAALLAPFKQELMQALQTAMAEDPVSAIEVCQLEAPAIAARLSEGDPEVGRSSHRLRNPANEPQPWVAEVIEHYRDNPDQLEPVTVALDDQRTGYAEAIVTQPMCLACHGDDLAPEVSQRISQLYPEDEATGFAAGDLRGVFWAEFADRAIH